MFLGLHVSTRHRGCDINSKGREDYMFILLRSARLAMMGLSCYVCIGSMTFCMSSSPAYGDDAAPAANADEKPDPNKALKEAKEKAELERDIAVLQKELIEAQVGKLAEGTTTISDKLSLEPEIIACQAITAIARQFAVDLESNAITGKFVVVDPAQENAVSIYKVKNNALQSLLSDMKDFYEKLPVEFKGKAIGPPAIAPPIEGAVSGLAALGQVLSFFRTDIEIKSQSFELDEKLFLSEISRAWTKSQRKVVYPPLKNPKLKSSFLDAYLELEELSVEVKEATGKIEKELSVKETEQKDTNKALEKDPNNNELKNKITELNTRIKDLKTLLEPSTGLLERFDDLQKFLMASFEKTGLIGLAIVLQGESLGEELTDGSHKLYIDIVAAGGNNKTKSNLLTKVFTGSRLSHNGGAIVNCIVTTVDGTIEFSKVYTDMERYKKADRIGNNFKEGK